MEQNTSVEQPLPPIKSLIIEAWGLYKSRFQTFVLISLLLVIFELIFIKATGIWLAIIVVFLYIALAVLAQAAILGNLLKNEDIGFLGSIKYATDNFVKYLAVSILVALVSIAGMVLIIPAIIWSISLSFAVIVLTFEGSTGIKALLTSREYVRGRWWAVFIAFITFQIFLFLIPTIIINILDIRILESLYSALVTPLSIVYLYVLYKYLKSSRPNIEIKDEKRFKVLAIFGLLIVIIAIALGVVFKDFLIEKGYFEDLKLQSQVK